MFFHAVVADSRFSEISVIVSHVSLSLLVPFILFLLLFSQLSWSCIVSSFGYCVLQQLDGLHLVFFWRFWRA
jgi:hypothetical protein